MQTTMTKKQARRREAREQLKAVSKFAKMLVKEGAADSVNQVIIEGYKEQNPEIEEFNTFKGWKDAGYKVKKGEKGFPIWGAPKTLIREEEKGDKGETEEKEEKYFPVAYLFADTQVEPIDTKN